jgi:hypothetical protein
VKDPPLQDGMTYAWRVRGKTDTEKELIKNQGYSSTSTFTYLPTCKIPSLVKSNPSKNKTALITWSGEGKEYLIQYREEGQTDWYEELSLTESLTITQLRPGKRYEYRIKSICEYSYSNYTKTDTFSIPYATNTTPLTPPPNGYPEIVLDKSTYLENAAPGMMIKVNHFEMKILKAIKNEQTKLWTGEGTMYFPSLRANVLMEFKNIHINKDQRLVAGHVHSVRAPKPITKVKLPPVKKVPQICLTYGPDGYDEEGYDKLGYDREGYNKEGRDKDGYDKLGYNQNNLDRNGNPKQTPTTTEGNPTASTGTNTNGNNSTQTGTNGNTNSQNGGNINQEGDIVSKDKDKYYILVDRDTTTKYRYDQDLVFIKQSAKIKLFLRTDSSKAIDAAELIWKIDKREIAKGTNNCEIDLNSVGNKTVRVYRKTNDKEEVLMQLEIDIYKKPVIVFERDKNYKGEYGFDHAEYKEQKQSGEYEKLNFDGTDYYVPWLTLLSSQTVTFKIDVDALAPKAKKG